MGELVPAIAFMVLVLTVIICVALNRSRRRPPVHANPADAEDTLLRVTVKLPSAKADAISDQLRQLVMSKKPGCVEFYENSNRVIRIVVD